MHCKKLSSTHSTFLFFVLAGLLVLPCTAVAGDAQHGSESSTAGHAASDMPRIPEPQGIELPEEEEHHFHKNHAGVFIGGTTEKEHNGFTLGGDYERRFHRFLGIGISGEHAWGSLKDTVVAFPVFFHPGAGLRIGAGPGFSRQEVTEEHEGDHGEIDTETATETEFLWRVQILYDFEVAERVTLTPNVSLDFVPGKQFFVYGVTLGYHF